jgi:hypothetical protein
MNRPLLRLAVALAAAAPVRAQSVVVPNANANVRGTSQLNTLVRNSGNPRTFQMGIAASELAAIPVGSYLTGVSFRAMVFSANPAVWPSPAPVNWTDYEITLGDAIPIPTWTTTFASNMTNATPVRTGAMTIPTGVWLHSNGLPVPQPNPWGDYFFDFQRPFPYSGGDVALLFSHPGSDSSTFTYLETVASDNLNWRALTATGFRVPTGGASPFCTLRLHYGYGLGCAGGNGLAPMLVLSNDVRGGGNATFAVHNGVPGGAGLYAVGLGSGITPLPNGCTLLISPLVAVLPLTLDGAGKASVTVALPPGASAQVFVQAFLADGGAPGGFAGSNGVTLTVNP